jgi:hypothetical protein
MFEFKMYFNYIQVIYLSFWKGTLPPYRETIDIEDNSIASPDSFHSIEDDEERGGNQSTRKTT